MRALFVISFVALVAGIQAPRPALADDCGFEPQASINLPDGLVATREQMALVTTQVRQYGEAVNIYLNCLDVKRADTLSNMNREQQARWNEDYDALLERLTALETGLNDEIRVYNNRPDDPDEAG